MDTEHARRSGAAAATAAEEERASVDFGAGNEIGQRSKATDGSPGAEGAAASGTDPPRTEAAAGAAVDASCSRGAAGSPCPDFDASGFGFKGFIFIQFPP